MIFRYDFVISIWIFIWFLLYFFKVIDFSPIFILVIASIIDTIAILFKIYNNDSFYNIVKFFVIQCVIKYIPLYIISSNNNNIVNRNNIISSIVFILLYIIYVYINTGSFEEMIKIYDRMLRSSTSKSLKDQFPLTALWNNIEKQLYFE